MKDYVEKTFGVRLIEREISIRELINSSKEGRLFEVFGGATHCHLLPIDRIVYQDTTVKLPKNDMCQKLSAKIQEIMEGNPQGSHWITPFE